MTVARSNGKPIPLTVVTGGAGKTCAAHLMRSVLEAGLGRQYGLITTRHVYERTDSAAPVLAPLAGTAEGDFGGNDGESL